MRHIRSRSGNSLVHRGVEYISETPRNCTRSLIGWRVEKTISKHNFLICFPLNHWELFYLWANNTHFKLAPVSVDTNIYADAKLQTCSPLQPLTTQRRGLSGALRCCVACPFHGYLMTFCWALTLVALAAFHTGLVNFMLQRRAIQQIITLRLYMEGMVENLAGDVERSKRGS